MINEEISKEELAKEMKWLRQYIKANPDLRNRKEAKNKYRIKALAEKRILERRELQEDIRKGNIINTEVTRLGKIEKVKKRIPEEQKIYTLCKGCEKRFGYYKFRKSPRKFCSSNCSSNYRYNSKMNKLKKNIEKS